MRVFTKKQQGPDLNEQEMSSGSSKPRLRARNREIRVLPIHIGRLPLFVHPLENRKPVGWDHHCLHLVRDDDVMWSVITIEMKFVNATGPNVEQEPLQSGSRRDIAAGRLDARRFRARARRPLLD
ncbi:hypothetical protein EHZ25_24865 [Paraburkholderia tropica]|nr:hypothetical protein [Paraburkholderia tropica]RQN36252.1 hypothetical protein EHZ25_24865 [Paraburkholderia tropica]